MSLLSNGSSTATIYPLSLHDALPISEPSAEVDIACAACAAAAVPDPACRICHGDGWLEILGAGMIHPNVDRKSTRLNSSHPSTSYAVFCLKKKRCRGRFADDGRAEAG